MQGGLHQVVHAAGCYTAYWPHAPCKFSALERAPQIARPPQNPSRRGCCPPHARIGSLCVSSHALQYLHSTSAEFQTALTSLEQQAGVLLTACQVGQQRARIRPVQAQPGVGLNTCLPSSAQHSSSGSARQPNAGYVEMRLDVSEHTTGA